MARSPASDAPPLFSTTQLAVRPYGSHYAYSSCVIHGKQKKKKITYSHYGSFRFCFLLRVRRRPISSRHAVQTVAAKHILIQTPGRVFARSANRHLCPVRLHRVRLQGKKGAKYTTYTFKSRQHRARAYTSAKTYRCQLKNLYPPRRNFSSRYHYVCEISNKCAGNIL